MGQHIVNTPVIYVLKNKYVDVSRKLKLLHCVDESQCLCGLWPFDKQHRPDEAQFSIVCPAPQWMGPILGDDSIIGGIM